MRRGFPAHGGLGRADLRGELFHALGHKGPEERAAHAQRFKQIIEHARETRLLGFVLREHPGGCLVDVLVGAGDHAEHLRESVLHLEFLHLRGVPAAKSGKHLQKLRVLRPRLLRFRQRAAEVFAGHGGRAGEKVAEIVCEIGVDGGDEKLVGEAAVRAEGEAAQQEEAQRVHAVALGEHVGIDDVALAFGHLAAVHDEPAVAVDLFRQRQTNAHKHRGPDDRVEADDLLADDVHVRGPVFIEIVVLVVLVAERGRVVEKRIDPNVYDVAGVKVHGHAPGKARAGYAEILQAALAVEEVVHHLVHAAGRFQELAAEQQLSHTVGVLAQTEEVGFLLGVFDLAAAVGAAAVHKLALGPEALARRAVHAGVLALIDITVVVHFAEDALDAPDMVIVRGADEAVVGDVHQLPEIEHALLAGNDLIDKLLRRDAGGLGLVLDFLAVLVGAGEEHHVIAAQTLVAGDRVACDGAVGVADVELRGGIVDRRGNIKGRFFHEASLS